MHYRCYAYVMKFDASSPTGSRVFRRFVYLCNALATCAVLVGCNSGTARNDTALAFSDCRIKYIDSLVRCAMVDVAEDHAVAAKPDAKTIKIHVIVIPSLARNPQPDPVYFFAGGPGQAASDIGNLVAAHGELRKTRDIVLVDQRGTGKSKTLTCDSDGTKGKPKVDSVAEAFSGSLESVNTEWAKCIATLKGNPALHRTDDYIDDLEFVRKALKHDQINVWGGSYGSRVALRYMKRYPQSIRTAVLDGVAPTTLRLPDDALASSELELRAVFSACASSAGCNAAYPDALASFDALVSSLRAKPKNISIPHPATGKAIEAIVSDRTLVSQLWALLYQPESARLLPVIVNQAARDNFAPLAATMTAANVGEAEIAVAQRFAVMCAEDMLGRSPAPNARFQSVTDMFYGFCKTLPHGKVAPEFFEPTTSSIPTLLLSGSHDPVTPPSRAALAAKSLSKSKHIVVNGMGHIVSHQPCARRIVAKFVTAGSIDAASDACEKELSMPRPLFYVSPLEAKP